MCGTPPENKSSCHWPSVCVGIALIAGVYYWNEWNDWKEKTKRGEAAEFMRSDYKRQQMQQEAAVRMLSEENAKFREAQQALEQEMQRRQNPSPVPPNFGP